MNRHRLIVEAGTGRLYTVTLRPNVRGNWEGLWSPAFTFSIAKGGMRYA